MAVEETKTAGKTMKVEPVMQIKKDDTDMLENKASGSANAKRRRRREDRGSKKPEEEKTEILYSVNIMRESEAEERINAMTGITDPERPGLRFVLLKRSTQRKLYKKNPRQVSVLGQRFRCRKEPKTFYRV